MSDVSVLDGLLVAVVVLSTAWWAVARHQWPAALAPSAHSAYIEPGPRDPVRPGAQCIRTYRGCHPVGGRPMTLIDTARRHSAIPAA